MLVLFRSSGRLLSVWALSTLRDFIRRTDEGYLLDLPGAAATQYSREGLVQLLGGCEPLICGLHPACLPPSEYELEHTTMSGFRLHNGRLTDELWSGASVLVCGLPSMIGWTWNMQPLEAYPSWLRGPTLGFVRMSGVAPATEEERITAIEHHHMPLYDGRVYRFLPSATKRQIQAAAQAIRILNGWTS